jgi:hypothetical protein
MITKWLKIGAMATVGLGLAGGLLFGKDIVSYARSSAKGVRTVVKDSVPIEFELRRARDLLEEIIPEMHANIRLIAQEEVEVAALKGEIAKNQEGLEDERAKIKTLRGSLETHQAQYSFAGRQYSREDVKADLAARFERIKESEWFWRASSVCWPRGRTRSTPPCSCSRRRGRRSTSSRTRSRRWPASIGS